MATVSCCGSSAGFGADGGENSRLKVKSCLICAACGPKYFQLCQYPFRYTGGRRLKNADRSPCPFPEDAPPWRRGQAVERFLKQPGTGDHIFPRNGRRDTKPIQPVHAGLFRFVTTLIQEQRNIVLQRKRCGLRRIGTSGCPALSFN